MSKRWDVIVVGAGMAGLTAGALARRLGASTVILEAHQVGGRARTIERQGFTFNMGAHALLVKGDAARILRSLGIVVRGAPPPLARYRARTEGHLHRLPTGPASLARTTLLGRRSKVQLAKALTSLASLDPMSLAGMSVSDWLGGQDLRGDVARTLEGLLRLSTYSADFDDLGADAAARQLQLCASGGVLYLDGGWKQLTDQLGTLVEVRTGTRVSGVEPGTGGVEVATDHGVLIAGRVVLAVGTPYAALSLLPADPGWGDLGKPVTAACLDVGLRGLPVPGYVLGLADPVYATVQSPPARQSPLGHSVVGTLRYGVRSPAQHRNQLQQLLFDAGVAPEDIMVSRFLARMAVAGSAPRACAGGLRGRPAVTATGAPGVYLAGDWVGDEGLLADASMASGKAAGLMATKTPS